MRIQAKKVRLPFIFSLCLCLMFALSACGKTTDDTSALAPTQNTQSTGNVTEQSATSNKEKIDEPVSENVEATEASPVSGEMEEYNNVLVVYFSHTGTTKGVSEYLHELVGGDLIEIEPVNPYPEGYSDALDPAKQEQRDNARPEIANEIEHFDSYEVIYLGYPIWWGTTPMIINTLLESYDFSGKTVVPYATSGGTGIGQSISDIKSEIPDADVKDGLLVKSNDDIIPWLQGMGLYE
ncbi:Flavodoxin [Pseudobutyrivibrio sp. YE44]|uniref:flavodoxin n=1 Tax=Pseudobutyrivibrio sp. YE44 TaxID=1520802 RepID=UPI00088CF541|nr:flavodoxin [Pseudobutyrivibrio sp. YE44]SDB34230.1 Flavodoxin [Pseudobutyrivibrio sp. YE44]